MQVAVLETARGGIIRSGLGYDYCDVAVVTNVAADHLGLKDVNTLEDLARVKAVVPRSVSSKGYAVLNAEDELVYAMRKRVDGKVVLFSMDENNEKYSATRPTRRNLVRLRKRVYYIVKRTPESARRKGDKYSFDLRRTRRFYDSKRLWR